MKLLLFVMLALPLAAAGDGFRWREISPKSLELTEDGVPVFVYNHGIMLKEGVPEDRARSTYIHPLYAPNGAIVSEDFPRDHYHHRGISWMWPIVKIDGVRYDLWLIKGIHQEFVRWIKQEPGFLAVENGWFVDGKKVVKEIVEIRAHKLKNKSREIEFKLSFEAMDKKVTLEGEPTGKKGYGGLNLRFADRQQTVIRTPVSANEPDSDLKPREWAELVGTYGGKRAGVRIAIDKSNPGAPNGWCLRKYGFLGVCYPGNGSHELVPGKPLTMKYKMTVFGE
jgi:Methane oxygenase PmoA